MSSGMCGGMCGKSMPDRDAMVLSPLEKWQQYRRPPFKIMVTITLAILATVQVLYISGTFSVYDRNTRTVFQQIFLTDDCRDGIFSMEAASECVAKTVDAFYNVENNTVGRIYFAAPKPDIKMTVVSIVYPDMSVPYADWVFAEERYSTDTYTLSRENPVGPLSPEYYKNSTDAVAAVKRFYAQLSSFTIEFDLTSADIEPSAFVVFKWIIQIKFSSDMGDGQLVPKVSSDRFILKYGGEFIAKSGHLVIDALLMLLSAVSTVLAVKSMYRHFGIFWRRRQALSSASIHNRSRIQWSDLPLSTKLQFFNSWTVVTLAGNTLIFLSSFLNVSTFLSELQTISSESARVLLGMGTFFVWTDTVKYLGYKHRFYLLILTLRNALPAVGRFLVSIMPLFLGYGLCGTIMFSRHSDRFSSLSQSCVTLFALLNGDEIRATFVELDDSPYPALGQIYCYTFVSLFICICLNVTIFLIEDAYHLAKGIEVEQGQDIDLHDEEYRAWSNLVEESTARENGKRFYSAPIVEQEPLLNRAGSARLPPTSSGPVRALSSRSNMPTSPRQMRPNVVGTPASPTINGTESPSVRDLFPEFDETITSVNVDQADRFAKDPSSIEAMTAAFNERIEKLLAKRQADLQSFIARHTAETASRISKEVQEFASQLQLEAELMVLNAKRTAEQDTD